ncbi:hypothetical protein SCHPADRAFT_923009 [Schizopora paradoxa]|uniref:non-specific serine/threonine protein kinase n=1 Tax=Schizopora paradoxa TaxID=27342 RepID=A0A0H2R594_9AGAM|nr:hypothetical protein SCHPADRAFT_923009 [Schizopora paradoxa]
MAFPPMYAQQPAKGTLMPGQMISVNMYNVQVERFLSQGGFAHVYLVRTAEPVFGTTHHVLKRIAVANEAMLGNVKKEVDIMRILRGHPNIVYLIDAAWHRMDDGVYEVFILMEFCSGGGIIDMMNRRLRERLTEAEILQVFVDVCEGVAAMHNLRPPLLHRDLKVENILQSSPTSYKLCDFGSTVPVATRPPSTTQEIRALEADLNQHTTLQYRAPEMVDVYLRRPVDEKSDVWALGVLLYKLCYYTTPFEEHGVLAILNVQYKFPPYPVYSQQLNALIASMLREHGAHRPTAFEVLNTVHAMRGTRSRFTYTIPPPRQPLSPRNAQSPQAIMTAERISSANARDSASPISAPRERFPEPVAPMRRGRPSSPTRGRKQSDDAFGLLDTASGSTWNVKPAKAHKSGLATVSTEMWKRKPVPSIEPSGSKLGDAWEVSSSSKSSQTTSAMNGFGDSFESNLRSTATPSSSSSLSMFTNVGAKQSSNIRSDSSTRLGSSSQRPDAFDSLSVFPTKSQAMTLGDAQKAALSAPKPGLSPSPQPFSKLSISPSPSSTSAHSPAQLATSSPLPPLSSNLGPSPAVRPKLSSQGLSVEERFPSLENLDAELLKSLSPSPSVSSDAPPQLPKRPGTRSEKSSSSATQFTANIATGSSKPSTTHMSTLAVAGSRPDGVRSQQVTGTAMRESRDRPQKFQSPSPLKANNITNGESSYSGASSSQDSAGRGTQQSSTRPALVRKHRSSVTMKLDTRGTINNNNLVDITSPVEPSKPMELPKDWLTGDDSTLLNHAVLRASPERRTAVLPNTVSMVSPQEAELSPTKRAFVPDTASNDIDDGWNTGMRRKDSSSDDAEDGPEDAFSYRKPTKSSQQKKSGRAQQSKQNSVHDLVDLWGGGVTSPKQPPPQPSSTSATKMEERRASAFFAAPPLTSAPSTKETMKSPPIAPKPSTAIDMDRLMSRSTITPMKSSSDDSKKSSSTNHLRQPSAPAPRDKQSISPTKPSTPRTSRSRPQSMLILPVQKSVSENSVSPAPGSALLPPPSPSKARSSRRSSISDLVSRYEAIDVTKSISSGNLVPLPGTKPARLKVADSPVPSPSAASQRFPKISPSTSPSRLTFNSSFGTGATSNGRDAGRSSSPTPGGRLSPPPFGRRSTSPAEQREPVRPSTFRTTNWTDSSSATKTSKEPKATSNYADERPRTPSPILRARAKFKEEQQAAAPASSSDEPRSPSPEKPFQGVSKLIDQWQKKTEEAGSDRNMGSKGGGSRFRRDVLVGK